MVTHRILKGRSLMSCYMHIIDSAMNSPRDNDYPTDIACHDVINRMNSI
jgi:hypothetical protein